jgi:hypothetical protein
VPPSAISCPHCGATSVLVARPRPAIRPLYRAALVFGVIGLMMYCRDRTAARIQEEQNMKAVAEMVAARRAEGAVEAAITAKQVRVGMTGLQAERAWGRPEKINRSEYGRRIEEQWVYPGGNYIYLTNNKVTSVTTSR